MKTTPRIEAQIGFIPLKTVDGTVTEAELIEVSIPSSEIFKIAEITKASAEKPYGCDLSVEKFMVNPIVSLDHDSSGRPIGQVTKFKKRGSRLYFSIMFTKQFLAKAKKSQPTLRDISILGGNARAQKLSPEKRIEIAKKASMASKKVRQERKDAR